MHKNDIYFFEVNRRVQAPTVLLLKTESSYNSLHETKKDTKKIKTITHKHLAID